MKLILLYVFIFFSFITNGQNKHFTIGFKNKGICFGNSKSNSGLRFSIRDKNVSQLNGLNFSGISNAKKTNGFTLGLVANYDSISNGIFD